MYLGKSFNCPTCRARVHAREIVKLFTNQIHPVDEGFVASKLRDELEAVKADQRAKEEEISQLQESLRQKESEIKLLVRLANERERAVAGMLNLRQDDTSASPIHPGQVSFFALDFPGLG